MTKRYCKKCKKYYLVGDKCPDCKSKLIVTGTKVSKDKKKDPLTACLLNLVIFGAGFWYLGQWGRGFKYLIIIFIIGIFVQISSIFWFFVIIAYIIAMVQSYDTAKEMNERKKSFKSEEDYLKILKTRYAKGEITKKEYDKIKKELE